MPSLHQGKTRTIYVLASLRGRKDRELAYFFGFEFSEATPFGTCRFEVATLIWFFSLLSDPNITRDYIRRNLGFRELVAIDRDLNDFSLRSEYKIIQKLFKKHYSTILIITSLL